MCSYIYIYIKRTSCTHVYIYIVSFNSTANQAQHKKHPNNLGIARGVVAKKNQKTLFFGRPSRVSLPTSPGPLLKAKVWCRVPWQKWWSFDGFWCMKTWHETFILGPEDSIDIYRLWSRNFRLSFLGSVFKTSSNLHLVGPLCCFRFQASSPWRCCVFWCPSPLGASSRGLCNPPAAAWCEGPWEVWTNCYKLWLGFEFCDKGHGNNKASFIVMSRPNKKTLAIDQWPSCMRFLILLILFTFTLRQVCHITWLTQLWSQPGVGGLCLPFQYHGEDKIGERDRSINP